MEILLVLCTGLTNVLCFFIGAKLGQKVTRGEAIEIPTPGDMIYEHKEKKAEREAKERKEILLANIDTYNGTSFGQRDIPR